MFTRFKNLTSLTIAALLLSFVSFKALGQGMAPGKLIQVQSQTEQRVRNRVIPVLKKYCHNSCELLRIDVAVEEEVGEEGDLGFESVMNAQDSRNVFVRKITADIQVDDMVSQSNLTRLEQIIDNHLRSFGIEAGVNWKKIRLPNIGSSSGEEQFLKAQLESKIQKAISGAISQYCPHDCVLAQVNIEGTMVSPDMARDYPLNQIVTDKSGRSFMRVDDADVEVTIDSSLSPTRRNQIANVFQARTKFVSPLNLNISVTPFPESYAEQMEKQRLDSQDPYGLEKLRRMLILFRELAGTKEIITSNTTSSEERTSESSVARESQKSTNSLNSKQVDSSLTETSQAAQSLEYVLWIGGALLLAGLLIALFMRVLAVNKDAQKMVGIAQQGQANQPVQNPAETTANYNMSPGTTNLNINQPEDVRRQTSLKIQAEELRNEIVQILMENPRVARETFGRMLREEGVEETAKYIKLLGQMVIIELLDDPNMQRDLYSLSEFYHNSTFTFEGEEEIELLQRLKTKITASEIRVLTRKSLDKFDFLTKLDSEQIFNLVSDESPQVQSIVLTQLDRKRRMNVFNMYQGDSKMSLMGELCKADAIPKEYLSNVALALSRKVSSRPEFDTQNLRASEVLVDLMEKADLQEQRQLMQNLQDSNSEAARGIKMRLVTVEMLPFLKDGHLLEIILGMEREELLGFLKGTRSHIRDLLINKAPPELSDSWVEDLTYMATVDESLYRLAEMNILRRVRNLANNGAISILEINEIIFSAHDPYQQDQYQDQVGEYSDGSMVA